MNHAGHSENLIVEWRTFFIEYIVTPTKSLREVSLTAQHIRHPLGYSSDEELLWKAQ